jgi:hypothetical protein
MRSCNLTQIAGLNYGESTIAPPVSLVACHTRVSCRMPNGRALGGVPLQSEDGWALPERARRLAVA